MKRIILGLICAITLGSCSNKEVSTDVSIDKKNENSLEHNAEDNKTIKAPSFTYTDINGKSVSLNDFKGKLVYMDIWATWCGPCKMQIPGLKALEEKYKNEDIVILSISIDPLEDKDKWRKMVIDKNLKGVQLYAGAESDFPKDYQVEFIPRFVIISPNGDILMNNAPQPLNLDTGYINPNVEQIFDIFIKTNKKATS